MPSCSALCDALQGPLPLYFLVLSATIDRYQIPGCETFWPAALQRIDQLASERDHDDPVQGPFLQHGDSREGISHKPQATRARATNRDMDRALERARPDQARRGVIDGQ
jgi:hypothetical protein